MEKQAQRLAAGMDRPPIIVSPYDAELYGHWWYEGRFFLSDLYRQLHSTKASSSPSHPAGSTWDRHPTNQLATPGASSWGLKGYGEQWVNESNAWTWRHIHAPASAWWNWPAGTGARPTRSPCGRSSRPPRVDAGAGQRLDVHHGHRHHGAYATRRFNEHIVGSPGFTKT